MSFFQQIRLAALRDTDPELVERLGSSVLDAVQYDSAISEHDRLLLQLGALIAMQAHRAYEATLSEALTAGVSAVAIKEVLYHAIPYIGMAKVLDFLEATNAALLAQGVSLPLASQATATTESDRFDKGLAIQKQFFGAAIERMQVSTRSDKQHIPRLLSANCFGDYYTRDGLDLTLRELLTFAMLAAMGGCDAQVKSHVAGNLSAGNDRARLIDAVTQLLPFIGYPRALNALAAIDAVAPAAEPGNAQDTSEGTPSA